MSTFQLQVSGVVALFDSPEVIVQIVGDEYEVKRTEEPKELTPEQLRQNKQLLIAIRSLVAAFNDIH